MPTYNDHIFQAKHNIEFLEEIEELKNFPDWKVTVCFYISLHLINAHLAKNQLQYRKHTDVKHAINPNVVMSLTKLPVDEYVAYEALRSLSRRSRYLVNEKDNQLKSTNPHFTYDKHFAKAIRHLDKLITFFNSKYNLGIKTIKVTCAEISQSDNLNFFSK